MRNGQTGSLRRVLAGSAGALALLGGHAALAADAPRDQATNVDEVVVTVQKRSEPLSQVPQSVTVVGEDTLDTIQANDFQDYAKLIPGLNLQSDTPGITRISLRGVNTGGAAATVSVYLDEQPFGSSSGLANGSILAGDFDTFDVARIEVLRGPQGTLYGASSLGGVLKFVTNAPSQTREIRAQASAETVDGGDLSYSLRAMFNEPLGDKLAFRASGFYRLDGGWIDSIGVNPVPDLFGLVNVSNGTQVAENINEATAYGGRASLLFTPTDTLSIRLTATGQNLRSDNANVVIADPTSLEQLYGGNVQNRYLDQPHTFDYRVYNATVDWDLGPVTLTSATGYSQVKEQIYSDVTVYGSFGAIFTTLAQLGALGAGNTGPYSAALIQQTGTKKFTQELRLASKDSDQFEWLVGAYYTDEDSGINPQEVFAVDPVTGVPVPGIPALLTSIVDSTYEEYAVFGNATWHISPRFDLTFGGRWSHNSQHADQFLDQTALAPLIGPQSIVNLSADSSEGVFTYSIAPRFNLDEHSNIYARIASGYRPGGPNILPANAPPGLPSTYDADRLTNYEVGYKGRWGAVSLDLAAFWLDWKDIQLLALGGGIGFNDNGGTAVSRGLEGSVAFQPTEHLTVTANAAYTDAYLTEDTDPIVGGHNGDPLPWIPKFAASVDAEYRWPVFNDADAFVGATFGYQGERPADFGTLNPAGAMIKAPAYATLDARLGVESGAYTVTIYARNLTDEAGVTQISGGPGIEFGGSRNLGIIRPRTIGVTVGAKF